MKRGVFLVTGGLGFLGSRLLPLLFERCPESEMILISRRAGVGATRRVAPTDKDRIEIIQGDLSDSGTWKKLPRNITHVFYLAASIPYAAEERKNPALLEKNLVPLLHLIGAAEHWKRLEQVIYASSVSVYGTTQKRYLVPLELYGAAKLAGEKLLLSLLPKKAALACLRYSSLYGFGQYPGTVLPAMIQDALQKKRVSVFGKGARTQDFLDCEDAARAVLLAYEKQARGIFNVGSGRPTSMAELARTVNRIFTGGRAEVRFERNKKEGRSSNPLNLEAAKNRLGFEPEFSLEDGLFKLKRAMNGNRP